MWQQLGKESSLLISFCIFQRKKSATWKNQPTMWRYMWFTSCVGSTALALRSWSSNIGSTTWLWTSCFNFESQNILTLKRLLNLFFFFFFVRSYHDCMHYFMLISGEEIFLYHGPLNHKMKSIKNHTNQGYYNSVADFIHREINKWEIFLLTIGNVGLFDPYNKYLV